jgi:hypothetical protein
MKKFLLRLVIFFLLVLLINWVFDYFYGKSERESIADKTDYKYIKWRDIHDSNNKFDLIFLGASHGYCALNPVLFDSILKSTSYNMCTSAQSTTESYFYLRDILKTQKPKYVIYDVVPDAFDARTSYFQAFANAQFLSRRLKWDMIICGFGAEGLTNYIFPMIPQGSAVKEDLKAVFKTKSAAAENHREWIKGYLYDDRIVSDAEIKGFPPLESIKSAPPTDDKLYYFKKLAELCQENNIRLLCITVPYPPSRFRKSLPYESGQYFKNMCDDNHVPFYDFNSLSEPGYTYEDSDFTDSYHMNVQGARKISVQVARLMQDKK